MTTYHIEQQEFKNLKKASEWIAAMIARGYEHVSTDTKPSGWIGHGPQILVVMRYPMPAAGEQPQPFQTFEQWATEEIRRLTARVKTLEDRLS